MNWFKINFINPWKSLKIINLLHSKIRWKHLKIMYPRSRLVASQKPLRTHENPLAAVCMSGACSQTTTTWRTWRWSCRCWSPSPAAGSPTCSTSTRSRTWRRWWRTSPRCRRPRTRSVSSSQSTSRCGITAAPPAPSGARHAASSNFAIYKLLFPLQLFFNQSSWKYPNVQMSKCPNVQMSKCPNVQMSKCPNVQMSKCPNSIVVFHGGVIAMLEL